MKVKRFLALMLSIVMVVGLLPGSVFAAYDASRTPLYDGEGVEVYDDGDGTYTLEVLDGTATAEALYNASIAIVGESSQKRFKFDGEDLVLTSLFNNNLYTIGIAQEKTLTHDTTISIQRCSGNSGSTWRPSYTYDAEILVDVKVYHNITVVTDPTDVGGVTYDGFEYVNGDSINVYTGDALEAIEVPGYGAVASGDADGVNLTPTASGTLTITYSATVADVVVGDFDSNEVNVTVNGTTANSGATSTVSAGTVTVNATAKDSASYALITVENSTETVASGVSSVDFTADAGEVYYVTVEVITPAIVLLGTEIDYNNANKTDYTTLENEIKALVESVAGEMPGEIVVQYKAGAVAGYKELSYEPILGIGDPFGTNASETIRITSNGYVWEGKIALLDLRPDAFGVDDADLACVSVDDEASIIAQAKAAIVNLQAGLGVDDLTYEITSLPALASAVEGTAVVTVSIDTDDNTGFKATTSTVNVPVVGVAQPAKVSVQITGEGSVTINGIEYTESVSGIELNEGTYSVVAKPADTDGTDASAGYISVISLTGVENLATSGGVYTNNAYAVVADSNYEINVTFATKTLSVKQSSETSPVAAGFNPVLTIAAQMNGNGTVDGEDCLEKKIFDAVVNSGASMPSGLTYDMITYQYYPWHKSALFGQEGLGLTEFNSGVRALDAAAPADDTSVNYHYYYDFGERYKSGAEFTTEKLLLTWKDAAGATVSADVYISLVDGRDTYTITWVANDGAWSDGSGTKTVTEIEGDIPTKPEDPTREYYTFLGWDSEIVEATVDYTYNAKWEPTNDANENDIPDELDKFTVVFMNADGSVELSKLENLALNEEITAYVPTAEETPEGMYFAGWSPVFNSIVKAEDADNCTITYKATWNEKCTVTIKYNNGNNDGTDTVEKNGTINLSDPSWEKHIFKGWYVDGVLVEMPYTVTTSVTITASWGEDRNKNGIEDGTENDPFYYYVWKVGEETLYSTDWLAGEDEITSGAFTYVNVANDSKTFSSWAEATDGNTTTYTVVLADDVNNNEIDDTFETAQIDVYITGNGSVELTPANAATVINKISENNYTVIFNSADTTDGNVVNVNAIPADTGVTDSKNYVKEAPSSVLVASGEGIEVNVEFDVHTLNTNANPTIKGNGVTVENKKATLTKESVLKAILGTDEFDADEYTVKMYVQIEYNALINLNGYYDIWTIGDLLGSTVGDMIWEKAVDIPGSEKFEITWKEHDIYPEVSGEYTVKMKDSREKATATHNGKTYNTAVLDDILLSEIEKDITVPNGVVYTVAWGEGNPDSLAQGQTYDVNVVVTMAETENYIGNTQTVTVTVTAPWVIGSVTVSDTANMTYNTGMTDVDKKNLVMEAINPVYAPESLADVETTVWYQANSARKVPVVINLAAMDLGVYSYVLPDSITIDVQTKDVWLNIGEAFPETAAPTNKELEAIVKNLIVEHGADYVAGDLTEQELYAILEITMKQNPGLQLYYDYLGAHKFGDNETKDANGNVLETVYVTQADTGYGAIKSNKSVITLADLRKDTSIKLNSDVSITYKDYTNESLLAALVDGVYDANGEKIGGAELVSFVTDVNNLPASEATEITVKYNGDINYKSCTATQTIVVNKANVDVNVESQTVKWGTDYNKNFVTTNPTGIDTINFIAGVDVSDMNVDDNKVKGIMGQVQLMLPEELQSLLKIADDALKNADLNVSFADGASMKLSELKKSVDVLSEFVKGTSYEEYLNVLINMLSSLPTDVADIEIIIGGEMPSNVGAYLIGAVSADANYTTSADAGLLVIYPDGKKAELDWKIHDENGMVTIDAIHYGDYDLGAYVTKVYEGTVEEAEKQLVKLFVGYDAINEKVVVTSDQKELSIGAYAEFAFISEFGNTMYYAVPVVRPILVVAENVNVELVGETNVEFDNTQKALEAVVEGGVQPGGVLSVRYIGAQTNIEAYNSTEPPKHAGIYTVIATYYEKNADGVVSRVGMDVKPLAIRMNATATIEVENAILTYENGISFDIEQLVSASDSVETDDAKYTLITGMMEDNGDFSENGLAAIDNTVNVDFPVAIDNILKNIEFFRPAYEINDGTNHQGITITNAISKIAEYKDSILALGISEETFTNLVGMLSKIPGDVHMTCFDGAKADTIGIYVVVGVITDPNYAPKADAGLVIIHPEITENYLKFNYEDENNIFTSDLIQSMKADDTDMLDLEASAYADKLCTVINEAATDKVENVFIEITKDASFVVTKDWTTLTNGAYLQLSYIPFEAAAKIDVSNLIARPVVIIPNSANVEFADGNIQTKIYSGEKLSMGDVKITDNAGNVITPADGELYVIYSGIASNATVHFGAEGPVHTGTYKVVAVYIDKSHENVGACVGTLIVAPQKAEINVDSQAVRYGEDYTIDVTTTPDDAKHLLITAGVNVDENVGTLNLSAINTINLDFPAAVDNVLSELGIGQQEITIGDFKNISDTVNSALDKIGYEPQYFNQVVALLDQMAPDVKITFEDNFKPINVGTYFLIATVFDPDYTFAIDTGILSIYPVTALSQVEFDMAIPGALNRLPYNAVSGFDFGVHVDPVNDTNGNTVTIAEEDIRNIIFGITTDAKIVLTSAEEKPAELGVYEQIGYAMPEITANYAYIAIPAVRMFSVVKAEADVKFFDQNGTENPDRIFTYGDVINIGAKVVDKDNNEIAGAIPTVYYMGIDTTLNRVWSTDVPTEAGVYAVAVYYFDEAQNIYTIGFGSMAIQRGKNRFDLLDAVVPYTGAEQWTGVINEYGTDSFFMVVDKTNSSVNLILEDDIEALKAVLESVLNREIPDTVSLSDIKETVNGADIKSALDKIIAEATKLNLPESEIRALNSFKEALNTISDTDTVTINGQKPVNVGEYVVYAISCSANYETELSQATLTIAPIYVAIDDVENSKVYGDSDPTLTANVSYYSYLAAEKYDLASGSHEAIGEPEKVQITTLPTTVSVEYDVVREAGEDVGTYDINIENVVISDTLNYATVVVDDDTKFEITKKSATIKMNASKVAEDAEVTAEMLTYSTEGFLADDLATEGAIVIAPKLNGSVITADYSGDKIANYDITIVDAELTRLPHEHVWGEVTYKWSEDGSSCTATRVCTKDATHVETAIATITSSENNPATEESKGTTRYTATFAEDWAAVQTKDIQDIAQLPHTHTWGEVVYTWSEDGSTCTATRTCTKDTTHVETATATITSEVAEPATEESKGTTRYTATFAEDWATVQTKDIQDIAQLPHTHAWGEVVYTWSEDGSTCTATRTCTKDTTHVETATAIITSEVAEPATEESMGTTRYTATFAEDWAAVQTKDIQDIAQLPHTHVWGEVVYEWSADGSTCTATRTCTKDATHVETATATVTSEVAEPATEESMGTTRYTATFAEDWATVQTKDIQDIAQLPHTHVWGEVVYTWSEDGSTCTATRTCTKDTTHVETAVATITSEVAEPATEESMGTTRYTATFAEDWATVQTKDIQDIAQLPHTHAWGEVVYTWSEDGSTCTATRTCTKDTTHVETLVATVTSEVAEPATEESMGTTRYTATFAEDWAAVQTKDIQDIAQLPHTHAWGEVVYTWSEDGSTCTATRTCTKDTTHVETAVATVTSEVAEPATEESMGTTRYTATFAEDWAAVQTKDIQDIAQLPHTHVWGEVVYTWSEDGSTCTATRTCTKDTTHVETLVATVTSEVAEPATEESKGTTRYTATFAEDWAAVQTKDIQDIAQLPHTHVWGEVVYEWSADGSACVAKRVCTKDATHVETAGATITSEVVEAATQAKKGTTRYTATFAADWAVVQTKDIQDIAKLPGGGNTGGGGGGGGGGGASKEIKYTVKFETNGGGKISSVKAKSEATLTEPTTPTREGYKFAGWYIDKELTIPFDFSSKVTKDLVLYAKWIEVGQAVYNNCMKNEICPMYPYSDLTLTEWYHDGVHYAIENGLMIGIDEDSFEPYTATSRAMIVMILWRLEGCPDVDFNLTFKDVEEGAWYEEAVRWAQANNVVSGYSADEFGPDDVITREQMAKIMCNYAKYKGYDVSGRASLEAFTDSNKISSWAQQEMEWMVDTGIINGMGDGTLAPQDNTERCQVATIFMRFCEMF